MSILLDIFNNPLNRPLAIFLLFGLVLCARFADVIRVRVLSDWVSFYFTK